jgi:hypothetical protein
MRLKKVLPGVLLLAGSVSGGVAVAHHDLAFTFDVIPATVGAVASTQGYSSGGTYIAAKSTVHLPPGALVAHADDRTSPVSPPPINGDQVGDGKNYSDLWQDGCGNPTTSTFKMTWVEPIGSGAPAGSVAELKLSGTPLPGLTISKRAFVVKSNGDTYHSAPHYDIVVPDMPDEFACSGSSGWGETTTYGFAQAGGVTTNRVVARNPSTAGVYTAFIEYTDTTGAVHSDFDTVSIK